MKKQVMIMIGLLMAATAAMAINYPTYKPTRQPSMQQTNRSQNVQGSQYGAYSTVATGGTTTTGEGSAIGGPRKVTVVNGNNVWESDETPSNQQAGDQWGNLVWDPGNGCWVDQYGVAYDKPYDPAPIGSPYVLLLFAAAACGVVYYRQKRSKAQGA